MAGPRRERVVDLRALLEDRFMLEWPRRIAHTPIGMRRDGRKGVFEVGSIIRSEEKLCVGTDSRTKQAEKAGLNDTVLMMATLGPWIRKQNKHPRDQDGWRNRFQEETRLSV